MTFSNYMSATEVRSSREEWLRSDSARRVHRAIEEFQVALLRVMLVEYFADCIPEGALPVWFDGMDAPTGFLRFSMEARP